MSKKTLAYIVTLIILSGVGLFSWETFKRINTQDESMNADQYQGRDLTISQEYCLTQGGELVDQSQTVFCRIDGVEYVPREYMIQQFTNDKNLEY